MPYVELPTITGCGRQFGLLGGTLREVCNEVRSKMPSQVVEDGGGLVGEVEFLKF